MIIPNAEPWTQLSNWNAEPTDNRTRSNSELKLHGALVEILEKNTYIQLVGFKLVLNYHCLGYLVTVRFSAP